MYPEGPKAKVVLKTLPGIKTIAGISVTSNVRQNVIDDEWYRVDLVFFHRRLRCLVIIDLKVGRFTHADAGRMHLYLTYAREHWVREGENPPVGLILCARKGDALARFALEGLPNKVMAAEYRTVLPDEKKLAAQIERTHEILEERKRHPIPPRAVSTGRR